jgi:hypothetical protein
MIERGETDRRHNDKSPKILSERRRNPGGKSAALHLRQAAGTKVE